MVPSFQVSFGSSATSAETDNDNHAGGNDLFASANLTARVPNVALFVDGDNIYLNRPASKRLDYSSALAFASSFGYLIKSNVYIASNSERTNANSVLLACKHMGYSTVSRRELHVYPDGTRKSDADVCLTMDAWEAGLRHEMDIVVLFSGDGDYVPLVERLVERGIAVYVVGPENATATDLILASTRFWWTSQIEGLYVANLPFAEQTVANASVEPRRGVNIPAAERPTVAA